MSLKIYLDECISAHALVGILQADGHDVVTAAQAGLLGRADPNHLAWASVHGRVLITADADDFKSLHDADSQHCGILAVYSEDDSSKDMSDADVARAIRNILATGLPIAQQFWVLNAWRY